MGEQERCYYCGGKVTVSGTPPLADEHLIRWRYDLPIRETTAQNVVEVLHTDWMMCPGTGERTAEREQAAGGGEDA
jgi:hypothetical protein